MCVQMRSWPPASVWCSLHVFGHKHIVCAMMQLVIIQLCRQEGMALAQFCISCMGPSMQWNFSRRSGGLAAGHVREPGHSTQYNCAPGCLRCTRQPQHRCCCCVPFPRLAACCTCDVPCRSVGTCSKLARKAIATQLGAAAGGFCASCAILLATSVVITCLCVLLREALRHGGKLNFLSFFARAPGSARQQAGTAQALRAGVCYGRRTPAALPYCTRVCGGLVGVGVWHTLLAACYTAGSEEGAALARIALIVGSLSVFCSA
ncbi:hypothetical protein COO60DRAFT_1627725 [Scenedesmus sp. NREL 46B-D3]|nr:hypothetical protein COO60DRAFT_1627725 [Scenedesmus sp. NREL 46B-D3]